MVDARVEVQVPGVAAHHVATQAALGELLTDLRSARELRTREHDAPPSDRSKGAATELIVSLGASGTLASFTRIIKLWLSRDRRRKVTIYIRNDNDGKTVTVEGDYISTDVLTAALTSNVKADTRSDEDTHNSEEN